MAEFEIKDGVAIIPEGVTEIGDDAFHGCTSLESITIPEGVTKIGYASFSRCTSLKSITIPKSVTKIASGFCYLSNVYNGCSQLESIVVIEGNPVYDSRECCNAIIETKTNTLIYGCKLLVMR